MLKHTRLALCLWHSRWCPLLLVSKAAEFQPRKNTPAPAGLAWTPGTLAGESHCAGWRVLELRVGFLETSLLPPTSSQIFPLYLFFLINFYWSIVVLGLPWWLSGKESTCQFRRHGFDPWVGKLPCRRKWQSIPVFLPGKSHGQRSLMGYSPWDCKRVGRDLATKQPP